MDKQQYTCVLVSDFNLQNFTGYVANDPEFPAIKAISAPFGQPVSTLLHKDLPCWQNTPDVAVVWTQPQSVISDFNSLLRYEQASAISQNHPDCRFIENICILPKLQIYTGNHKNLNFHKSASIS